MKALYSIVVSLVIVALLVLTGFSLGLFGPFVLVTVTNDNGKLSLTIAKEGAAQPEVEQPSCGNYLLAMQQGDSETIHQVYWAAGVHTRAILASRVGTRQAQTSLDDWHIAMERQAAENAFVNWAIATCSENRDAMLGDTFARYIGNPAMYKEM